MNTKHIAEKYGIDKDRFETFLRVKNKSYDDSFFRVVVDDANISTYVEEFFLFEEETRRMKEEERQKKLANQLVEENRKHAEELAEDERRKRERIEEQNKKIAMTQMLISSGFSFEGYKIVKYSGYISGDDATQIPRSDVFGGQNGENLTHALVKIRRKALVELKEAAYQLGCNAVVGVDFDYITLAPETANITGGTLYEPYVICVTANGNAVVIEKIQE